MTTVKVTNNPETIASSEEVKRINVKEGPGQRGLSAYEVAVNNGFSGTEQEWLASLASPPASEEIIIINAIIFG